MTTSFNTMGIIGAMDVEIALLREEMAKAGTVKITRIAGMEFNVGTIGNTTVIVVQCGVGMVNAATCAQVLVDRFGVSALLNTGIAGSLDASINIGDVVVADDAANHIMDVCNLGYAAGQTPGLDTLAFPCSPALSKSVVAAASAIGATVHTGRVASGDRFVRDNIEKQRITETFDAKCCEMEGAAIAQVAWANGVPCAIVRAISDKADGSSSMDYPTFEAQAARNSAALVIAMLERQG